MFNFLTKTKQNGDEEYTLSNFFGGESHSLMEAHINDIKDQRTLDSVAYSKSIRVLCF